MKEMKTYLPFKSYKSISNNALKFLNFRDLPLCGSTEKSMAKNLLNLLLYVITTGLFILDSTLSARLELLIDINCFSQRYNIIKDTVSSTIGCGTTKRKKMSIKLNLGIFTVWYLIAYFSIFTHM